MDTVKQVMKGRSAMIERGIDTAVERLGRYGTSLRESAEGAKVKLRALDPERGTETAPPTTPTPTPGSATRTPPATGPALRGDLVDQPPGDEGAPPGEP